MVYPVRILIWYASIVDSGPRTSHTCPSRPHTPPPPSFAGRKYCLRQSMLIARCQNALLAINEQHLYAKDKEITV